MKPRPRPRVQQAFIEQAEAKRAAELRKDPVVMTVVERAKLVVKELLMRIMGGEPVPDMLARAYCIGRHDERAAIEGKEA